VGDSNLSISVVIPARDAGATLPATLAGLERQEFAHEFEVIVVDDHSGDDTAELAARSPVVSRVVHRNGEGPAAARNAGASLARGSFLAFIDADCRPAERWLSAGSAALEEADLVLGRVRAEPDQPLGPFDRTLWVTGLSPLYESANLFVRRELFDALHGFEGWLGPRDGKELGEDVWFGWRAQRGGARIAACDDALVYHAVFPRGALGFVGERWRLRFFPALAGRVPELRTAFFYRRVFLSRRSAAFDLALAGALVATARRNPLALAAALPYARLLRGDLQEARDGWPAGVSGARLAGARLAADAVGAVAMAYGSVRSASFLM
jgi:glycosyltransferase involved in cell wall biosynthesis